MHSPLVIFKVDHIFRLLSKQVALEKEMDKFEQETEKLGEFPQVFSFLSNNSKTWHSRNVNLEDDHDCICKLLFTLHLLQIGTYTFVCVV